MRVPTRDRRVELESDGEESQRRVRHPTGVAGLQNGAGRARLVDQPPHPARVDVRRLHRPQLRHAVRGASVSPGPRLVVTLEIASGDAIPPLGAPADYEAAGLRPLVNTTTARGPTVTTPPAAGGRGVGDVVGSNVSISPIHS